MPSSRHLRPARSERGRVGARGEALAVSYLRGLGWRVLDRNWRGSAGELDIVALDPRGVCVFVEVKCRRGEDFGPALAALDDDKIARIASLGQEWLQERRAGGARSRIDGVGVLLAPGAQVRFTHVEGVTL